MPRPKPGRRFDGWEAGGLLDGMGVFSATPARIDTWLRAPNQYK